MPSDCSVKIPERGLTEQLLNKFKYIQKTLFVTFNPLASDDLCISAFNGEIHICNALKGDSNHELNAEDTPT